MSWNIKKEGYERQLMKFQVNRGEIYLAKILGEVNEINRFVILYEL